MNLPLHINSRWTTQDVLKALQQRRLDGPRIFLDKRGDETKRPPFGNLREQVTHHARAKRKAEAEGLYIVEKMASLGIVGPTVAVGGTKAVLQTFSGVNVDGRASIEGAHVMPCQLTFNQFLPFLIPPPAGQQLTHTFQHRNMVLFSKCSWQPSFVNDVDQALEHAPGDFIDGYLSAVRAVRQGYQADEVYRVYSSWKHETLSRLRDLMNSLPTFQPSQLVARGAKPDAKAVDQWNTERETVLEVYTEQERVSPTEIVDAEMKQQITSETWLIEANETNKGRR
jgi:hypothetical protein